MANKNEEHRQNRTIENKVGRFKLVLLGDYCVGKSSLVLRFVKGEYCGSNEANVGVDIKSRRMCIDNNTVKFEIWDTPGQERFDRLAPFYYRDADGAIVVYDITRQDSFERTKAWIKDLQRYASPNIIIGLAGNKADLSDQRMITSRQAQLFADENSLIFMETSAKTSYNVSAIFIVMAKQFSKFSKQSISRGEVNVDLT